MKAKKWLTIITGAFSITSIIAASIIGKESNCIFYDILLAIFGSALLGTIMSLTEYFVERRKAMEIFWGEAGKVLKNLRKIRYINVDVPHELVRDCFKEEVSNKLRKRIGDSESNEARGKLISWLEEKKPMLFIEGVAVDHVYETGIANIRKEYQNAIDSYSSAASIDLGPLSNAYGGLDFFRNKNIRDKAFNEIYSRIREFSEKLYTGAYHFNLLKEGQGSYAVCADKAYQICQLAFVEEHKYFDGFFGTFVYQKLFDEIDDSLEWFRCEIYRSEKYKPIEVYPVLEKVEAISLDMK